MTTHLPVSTAADACARRDAVGQSRWHFAEYALEALELALFMIAACLMVALVEHPESPLHDHISAPWLRRLVVGSSMGLTAIALIYSPWGKRSGAHMNPAVTLTYWALGKVEARDAVMYVIAQFAGAGLGVGISRGMLGPIIAHSSVDYVRTLPARGTGVAFAAELAISTLSMSVVLATSSSPRLSRFTGMFCGVCVAAFITLEAPLSGMSMNPARTFGSAVVAGRFEHLWLYLTAPPIGMMLAALGFSRLERRHDACAKLRHDTRVPCIFCSASRARQVA